jgi:hypothetical protein
LNCSEILNQKEPKYSFFGRMLKNPEGGLEKERKSVTMLSLCGF